MARSLNPEEAAIFQDDSIANEQFSAFMSDFAEGLLKHQEEDLELTTQVALWLRGRFPGS
ncbi:MAG TPA: hypothetical protein VKV04_10675 [Verrucomicrobiae bacterium]|nr:hypothetical protein [Verrucomicrobiae bacterium]